jgi:hypothetical protein
MSDLTPPLLAVERESDVSIYETLDQMAAAIEAYDVKAHDFYDSTGKPLTAKVDGYRVVGFDPAPEQPDPQRLESILRDYFRRLPERDRSFSVRAADAASLSELVDLSLEYRKVASHENQRRRLSHVLTTTIVIWVGSALLAPIAFELSPSGLLQAVCWAGWAVGAAGLIWVLVSSRRLRGIAPPPEIGEA